MFTGKYFLRPPFPETYFCFYFFFKYKLSKERKNDFTAADNSDPNWNGSRYGHGLDGSTGSSYFSAIPGKFVVLFFNHLLKNKNFQNKSLWSCNKSGNLATVNKRLSLNLSFFFIKFSLKFLFIFPYF